MLDSFRPELIAVDMDGTMLNEDGELTPRTEAALKHAIACGIKVIAATGRMYISAIPILRRIGATTPCVFFNGALIRNPRTDEIVYERTLGKELTSELLAFYRENSWYIQIYHDDQLFVVDDSDERCKFYEKASRIKAVSIGERFWNFDGTSVKMLGIAFEKNAYAAMVERTVEKFAGRLYTATSWGSFIEMVHPEVNKARSLARVAESLGVEQRNVLAFGDGANDKEMLAWAGVGVAMGNASDSVRECADVIAPDNGSDGVAVIIEKLLQRRVI